MNSLRFTVVDAASLQPIAKSVASIASTAQPVREDKSFDSATTITTTSLKPIANVVEGNRNVKKCCKR